VKANRFSLTTLAAGAIGVLVLAIAQTISVKNAAAAGTLHLPVEGSMPSLGGAVEWINSPPLTPQGLRGKVVLVEFWTYTCINWRRQLPFVRAWAEKYKNQGLVVIGVHTPEFEFEKKLENIRWAAKDMSVNYPIAVDSDYATWRAFGNEYWPALYFIDARGRIRHHQFGEGEYEQSERVIQQLLADAGAHVGSELVSIDAHGAEAAADWRDVKSSENYLGFERTENFASPGGAKLGQSHRYSVAGPLQLNHWAVTGDWTFQRQTLSLNQAGGGIVYRFHARDLHLILGPPSPGVAVRFRVRIDGEPPGAAHGSDVDAQGNGTVNEQRMYQLIRQPVPIIDRDFEIEFLDPGVEAFSVTFG